MASADPGGADFLPHPALAQALGTRGGGETVERGRRARGGPHPAVPWGNIDTFW